MILKIILLFLTVLILGLLITFVFFVLEPSIESKNGIYDNLIINLKEKIFYKAEQKAETKISEKKAFVLVQKQIDIHSQNIDFNVMHTCKMLKSMYFTDESYSYVCIGQGDCVRICEQKAISIVNGSAVINQMCCGCRKCLSFCPQNIIKMLPPGTTNLLDVPEFEDEIIELCNKDILEKKVEWKPKKYFKLWAYCYRMFNIFKS